MTEFDFSQTRPQPTPEEAVEQIFSTLESLAAYFTIIGIPQAAAHLMKAVDLLRNKETPMGTKNNPSEFDCYGVADPDEPLFVLRGKDPLAAVVVRTWALLRLMQEAKAAGLPGLLPAAGSPRVREAFKCARDMQAWCEGLGQEQPMYFLPPEIMQMTKLQGHPKLHPQLRISCYIAKVNPSLRARMSGMTGEEARQAINEAYGLAIPNMPAEIFAETVIAAITAQTGIFEDGGGEPAIGEHPPA